MNRLAFSLSLLLAISWGLSLHAEDPKRTQAEAACRDKLTEIRRLAKDGCSKEIRTSIRDCITAGITLGICVEAPNPVTCVLAAIEIDRCREASAARQECISSQKESKSDIEKVRDGDCFATIATDGKCIFICKKDRSSIDVLGMIDLRDNNPTKALKFFKRK